MLGLSHSIHFNICGMFWSNVLDTKIKRCSWLQSRGESNPQCYETPLEACGDCTPKSHPNPGYCFNTSSIDYSNGKYKKGKKKLKAIHQFLLQKLRLDWCVYWCLLRFLTL